MTAQFSIINSRRHIFASDNGITTPEGKKYEGMQKIFKLSDVHPAQIMINGCMEFEGIPMETIINEFVKKTKLKELKNIEDIKNEFLNFLAKYTPKSSGDEYIHYAVENFKENIIQEINEKGFYKAIETKKKKKIYPFIRKYSRFKNEFEKIIPKDKNREKYSKILWEIFSYELRYEGTGVIISGHNIGSPYPSFFEINIHCNSGGKIIYEELESKIDFEETIIRVHAINEEGYTFFTGVNENFVQFIDNYINETNEIILLKLKSKLKKENITDDKLIKIVEKILFEEYSDVNHEINNFRLIGINDTSKSIEFIPNILLCILADEIIRLTALKQKISSEDEYVSMSSHISLMTKSQGFKWVKFNDEII